MKIIVLENIRSAYNVGAIFRTADAAGMNQIYLTGFTPTPRDRFGRVQAEIAKTSLGASATVPWEYASDCVLLIKKLQADGLTVVAAELMSGATPLPSFVVPTQVAYVFGSEVSGVSAAVLEVVDNVVAIPMRGQKESLNVSVAAGIMMYHGVV